MWCGYREHWELSSQSDVLWTRPGDLNKKQRAGCGVINQKCGWDCRAVGAAAELLLFSSHVCRQVHCKSKRFRGWLCLTLLLQWTCLRTGSCRAVGIDDTKEETWSLQEIRVAPVLSRNTTVEEPAKINFPLHPGMTGLIGNWKTLWQRLNVETWNQFTFPHYSGRNCSSSFKICKHREHMFF